VKKVQGLVDQIEVSVNESLAVAQAMSAASSSQELMGAQQDLQKQQSALQDVQRTLMKDLTEARKGGAASQPFVAELTSASPRLRTLHTGLVAELAKVKGLLAKAPAGMKPVGGAGALKPAQPAQSEAERKAAEEKDTKEFQECLPAVKEVVNASDESADSVVSMAAPLIADPPEDTDSLTSSMEEIEAAAADTMEKITEARKQINLQLQVARKFAPETRKTALLEFSGLQQKLTEAQKKVNPYKSFKKEFHARVAARKACLELTETLSAAELEVEKAKMMGAAADLGQMAEEDIGAVEKVAQPALTNITASLRLIDQKLKAADGAMKDELNQMKDRTMGYKKELDAVILVLTQQRQGLATNDMLKIAAGKVDVAEEAVVKCQDAELPFLKGMEVLPEEESAKAIKDCEMAATQGEQAVNGARAFLKSKLLEAKKLVKDLAASVTEELNAQLARLEVVAQKTASFKKETMERKTAALLAEVVDGVAACERKVEALARAADLLATESKEDKAAALETLDALSIEDLKGAIEKSSAAEKEATAAMLEARKVFGAKQKEAKGPEVAQAVGKIQARINAAQSEIAKAKKATSSGEKLLKGKEALAEEEVKVKEIEDSVKAAERKVKPGEEEEAMGIEAACPSDEEIEAMGSMLVGAQKTLKQSAKVVEAHLLGAPASLKAALQALAERCKASQKTATEVLALTKDQRERIMSAAHVRDGQAKVAEVDAVMEKINDAELPFLKGLEVIPLQEANDAMKASETAATAVQKAITEARNFIASKSLEIKQYGQEAAKPVVEEFGQLTTQINAAAARLAQFRQDTEARKKTALMQEAGEKVDGIEAELKKLDEVIEPFAKEDGEKEESEEAADKMVEQYRATQAAIDEAKKLMLARQKDAAGNTAHTETVKELNKRIAAASTAVTNHKKVASVHEGKFLAKKARADAEATMAAVEEQVQKATTAAAPLLEEAGERFLVAASARTLAQAWRDHMKAKELTHEAVFAGIAGGAAGGGVPKDAFVEHLAKLPAALEREEIAFSDARREAIFAHLDKDGDGKISCQEFKDLFLQRFKVTKEITVTDLFDVAKSKSLFKVTDGEILETVHGSQTDESSGMTRIECTVVSKGQTGFVTMSGNQGTKFVDLISPFSIFCKELDETIEGCMKATQKLVAAFNSTQQEVATSTAAPLVEAKAELLKLKPKVSTGQQGLQKLKLKVAQEKKGYGAKELREKNAHIEAKERRAAEALTSPAASKVEAMDASLAALEEAVKTLVSLSKEELVAFPTPLSVSETADRLADEVSKAVDAAKESIAAQQGELPKEVKGPMAEAKRELMKMSAKAEQVKKKIKSTLDAVRSKCQHLVEACAAAVSSAMRAEMQSKGLDIEAYFMQLVNAGDDKISHEAFCRRAEGLIGEAYRAEHAGLLCRQIEAGAISRRRFQSFLQQYFVVVKGIAITDEFPISTAKTLRKAEVDEVLELLEGPKADDKLGISRIRGKSLVDNLEGWISLMGNQGTPFLTEVEKPFYTCLSEVILEREFKSEGADGVTRTVAADEVLELLEGPRKQTFEPALRVRGKAIADGAMGWFTARDRNGNVLAEADSKYYSCTSSVAMTDNMDIKDCKVLRKLVVGELFTVEEGPVEVKEAGVTRVKGRCLKDDLVGWITIKGNAGTQFAEASSKHFCVLSEVPLTKAFPTAKCGEEVRKLAKGEAMQVLEGPKEESFTPEVRVKVKALTDGAVGWITQKKDVVKPWTPYYTCKVKAQLQESLAVEGATAVREIQVGERLELVEGPAHDGKVLRVKARADKDGAVGWVTVKDSEGKRYFTS